MQAFRYPGVLQSSRCRRTAGRSCPDQWLDLAGVALSGSAGGDCSGVPTSRQGFSPRLSLTFRTALRTFSSRASAPSHFLLSYHFVLPVQLASGPAPSAQSFLRGRCSASVPAAICLIISVFLLKNPRSNFSWWILKDLNTDSPYKPEIPLLVVYPKDLKVGPCAYVQS